MRELSVLERSRKEALEAREENFLGAGEWVDKAQLYRGKLRNNSAREPGELQQAVFLAFERFDKRFEEEDPNGEPSKLKSAKAAMSHFEHLLQTLVRKGPEDFRKDYYDILKSDNDELMHRLLGAAMHEFTKELHINMRLRDRKSSAREEPDGKHHHYHHRSDHGVRR